MQGGERPSRPDMRLFVRLLISHAAPVLVVTLGFTVVLLALGRIQSVLTTLSRTELVALHDEGTVHRAAWGLDVSMRRGQTACASGEPGSEVAPRIEASMAALRAQLSAVSAVSEPMRQVTRGYLEVAAAAVAGDACQNLTASAIQLRRSALDEQLTDLWVGRLAELHAAVDAKDELARATATTAIWTGFPLLGLSFVLAMLLAAQMARVFKRPLAALSGMARRVGQGDFGSPVLVRGPAEIVALADELERMRAQLQHFEKLKQGFLASVSHELRTPLSKIREALALLSDGAVGELEPRQMRVVQIARTACEREIRMVTTLLDLSRLRAGSPLRLTNGVSLESVVQRSVNDESAEATSRGVEVQLIFDAEGARCRLDPVLMECAVANLVRNAVAVSKRGQLVTIACERAAGPDGAPGFRVTVEDQGPGVPPAIRATVFDAFVTHEVPTSGKAIGVGIGLALAREVARAHAGDLTLVEEWAGTGARFELWLPADDVAPPPLSSEPLVLGFPAVAR